MTSPGRSILNSIVLTMNHLLVNPLSKVLHGLRGLAYFISAGEVLGIMYGWLSGNGRESQISRSLIQRF